MTQFSPSTRRLCIIPGDGIGPEVTAAAESVLLAVLPDLEIERAEAGWGTFEKCGSSVPVETLESIRRCRAALFGAVSSPSHAVAGYRSAILQIRQELGLSANIRPVNGQWCNESRGDINLVIVRENTEDLYVRRERVSGEVAIAERWISRAASTAIGRRAAEIADYYGKQRITIVHKANVLPITDGLFRDSVREGIASYEGGGFEVNERLVDVAALQLVAQPESFEIIVTTNMFGDILSDLAAHWCGGLGRAPSLNLGNGIAVAEPVHGSAPDIAGQDIADPTAAILSAAMLCRLHWQDTDAADLIERAVLRTISKASTQKCSTTDFTRDILLALDSLVSS